MANIWITNNTMSLSDMENNVKIIYPTLYGMRWKKPAIIGICAWMEYVSSINPEAGSGDIRGLLMWNTYEWPSSYINGDEQLNFFNSTAADKWDETGGGTSNSLLALSLDAFRNSDDMNPTIGSFVFGACYMHVDMDDVFLRQELGINCDYWSVYIDTLPQPPEPGPEPVDPDNPQIKKRKMWKFLKPRWR